jgi:nitroreductase
MNETIKILQTRKSVRAYETMEIPKEIKDAILSSTFKAPTAGNMMLYSVIDIKDQEIKNRLVKTCDDQPFIAKAPFVLLFLADYQRWYDYFKYSKVQELCNDKGEQMRKPQEGDLLLACCDALIAAQTAVVAAESLGIGSCYIGDIMENYEIHKELFDLPEYVFPITMVCFGYPTKQQKERKQPKRFEQEYIVFEDKYKRLSGVEFDEMYRNETKETSEDGSLMKNAQNVGQHIYLKKFSSDYSIEMSRSVKEILKNWK